MVRRLYWNDKKLRGDSRAQGTDIEVHLNLMHSTGKGHNIHLKYILLSEGMLIYGSQIHFSVP